MHMTFIRFCQDACRLNHLPHGSLSSLLFLLNNGQRAKTLLNSAKERYITYPFFLLCKLAAYHVIHLLFFFSVVTFPRLKGWSRSHSVYLPVNLYFTYCAIAYSNKLVHITWLKSNNIILRPTDRGFLLNNC